MTQKKSGHVFGVLKALLGGFFGQSALFMLAGMAPKAAGVILMPIRTRFLTPEDYGVFGTLSAVSGFLMVVISLGLLPATVTYFREYAEDRERFRRFFGTVLVLTGTAAAVLVTTTWLGAGVLWDFLDIAEGYRMKPLMGYMLAALFINALLVATANDYFVASQQAAKSATLTLSAWGIGAVLSVAFLYAGWDVEGQFLATLIGIGAGGLGAAFLLRRERFRPRWSSTEARRGLAFGIPLIPHLLAFWANSAANRVIVAKFVSFSESGYLSVGTSIAAVMVIGSFSLAKAWSPRAFRILKERDDADAILTAYFRAWLVVMGCATVLVAVAAPWIIRIFATKEFTPAAPYVSLLSLAAFTGGIYQLGSIVPYFYKKTRPMPILSMIAAAVSLTLSLLLVPIYGGLMAAVSAVVASVVLAVLFHVHSWRTRPIQYGYGKIIPYYLVIAAAVVAAAKFPAVTLGAALAWLGAIAVLAPLSWLLLVGRDFVKLKAISES